VIMGGSSSVTFSGTCDGAAASEIYFKSGRIVRAADDNFVRDAGVTDDGDERMRGGSRGHTIFPGIDSVDHGKEKMTEERKREGHWNDWRKEET